MVIQPGPGRWRPHGRCRGGYSLIELLVVIFIIGILAALVLAALSTARATARGVLCMNNLKQITFSFTQFADHRLHPNRGDSARYGPNLFHIEDFQESLYGIDEFWRGPEGLTSVRFESRETPMMCPDGPKALERRKGLPCSAYAVTPTENVSIGFNMRLHQISVTTFGWPRLQRTRLSADILERTSVPLAFDVDGHQAKKMDVLPYYSAPEAGDAGPYGGGRFWFPSTRHRGLLNAAFIGGHVLRSAAPEDQAGWNWSYQPPLR